MPNQDEIMQKIYDLVSKGAGVELSSEDKAELHGRYYDWIAKKKNRAPASPQEVWETGEGEKIQKQFEKIGREMAHQRQHLKAAAATVEMASDCPFCPDPTG